MKSRLILAAFTTIALMAANNDMVATETLSLRVTPNVSSAPSNVIVKATIAKPPANRWPTVQAHSAWLCRSSAIQRDGDQAPTVTEIRLHKLPSGEYAVSAVLKHNLGEETMVRRTVIVLSRFGEP